MNSRLDSDPYFPVHNQTLTGNRAELTKTFRRYSETDTKTEARKQSKYN